MFINSHLATGYLLHRLKVFEKKWLILWLTAAVIPDIDGLWSKSVVEHHSILHTPSIWIVICGFGWFVGFLRKDENIKTFFIILFIGSNVHLFTDYITARTVGIKWMYPLNNTDYYLFPIKPENGNIPIWEMIVDPYITFYVENKILTGIELLFNFLAIILYLFYANKSN